MANTFRLHTADAVGTSAVTLYTVGSSTTTIILGLILGNVTGSAINATVTLESNTDHDDGTSDTETNGNIELVTNAPIPAGGSLETLGGGKLVLQTTDILRVTSDTASSLDVALSIMEIT
jgi:hypothetical protein